ncbi:MAG: hypothetical protein A4E30_01567 [Methanomassiliicoccales archaeon PtaB.Bin215]|nr:MAG: hypothetical protein A4E30_01567 [Methanomassiliicoccales archaeon PtaB.Bin215]
MRAVKNRLRVYRTMTNLTQGELAEKLGITRQTVIAIEKERYDPSLDLAFKLAKFFRVSIEDIFQYEEG